MKVYNPLASNQLLPELSLLLNHYRQEKSFNAQNYLDIKACMLNQYMKNCGLKACVVAVSGGIDSALVLGIVKHASTLPNSPIEKILPVCLPVSHEIGATGQYEATMRGQEVCRVHNLEPFVIELSSIHKKLHDTISQCIGIEGQAWAKGQLVAHSRTPSLYYCATLLTQNDLPAIIVGTTNRDEGLYLGYFGKASDGLVDLQLISDLHKSEVYKVAQIVSTPESIMQVSPQGDMYDGRIDEEVFGSSYDFVEYYLHYLTLQKQQQETILNKLTTPAKEQFVFFSNNLENLHRYNGHKYVSASPAVHLDLDYMNIKGGWKTNCNFDRKIEKPVNTHNFVGLMNNVAPIDFHHTPNITTTTYMVDNNPIYCLNNCLNSQEIAYLLEQTKHNEWKPANIYGKTNCDNTVMSERMSMFNEQLAQILYARISPHIPKIISNFDDVILPRIFNNKKVWVSSGINPLLRYIRYNGQQQLIAHYDDTYQYHEYKKTLMSVIIYLEDSPALTRFIYEPQHAVSESLRNYDDWDNNATDSDVALSIAAKAGQILIFPHRLLHDSTSPGNTQKTIIRTDIVFQSPQLGFDL